MPFSYGDSRIAVAAGVAGAAVTAFLAWRFQTAKEKQLSIFSWNILAPIWIDYEEYKHINGDLNLLHPDKRLLLIIERILQSDADIVTLQEVQADQYKVLCSELAHKYESLGLTHHILSYWTSEWLGKDVTPVENGQATFVRKGKFKLLHEKTIQTTDEGSRLQIVALRFIDFCQIFANDSGVDFILVNQHLESGMEERKHLTRQQQVVKIHDEVEKMKLDLTTSTKSEPRVILVGDFNTYGDQLGMKEVRNKGYIDVAEMLGCEKPTFIVVDDDDIKVTLDHVALLKNDVEVGRVSAKKFIVPDVESLEYNASNHKDTILNALYHRLERRGLPLKDALKDLKTLSIVAHIPPSREDFREHRALKALRIGSDHLPVYAELALV